MGVLTGLDIFRQALSYTYRSAKIEEDPGLGLAETLDDALFTSLQSESESWKGMYPGREYYVNTIMTARQGIFGGPILAYGGCHFAWVCNRSGGTLAQGALVKWQQTTITNADGGSISTVVEAGLTANELVGDLIICTDDAGGAGAAPEGEGRYITKNTSGIITVQPDWSAAVAAGDDFVIRTNSKVIASVVGDTRAETAGVVVNPDGIADNYWGWVLSQGRVGLLGKAATVITTDKMIIAEVGRVDVSAGGASDHGLGLGYALSDLKADSVSDIFWAYLDVRSVLADSA